MRTGRRGWSAWAAAGLLAAALANGGTAAFELSPGRPAGAAVALAGEAAPARAGLPQRLSETGLYLADGSVDPRNRHFAPQYPLWSDGAEKNRWVRLPEGATIDVSDLDAWRFPAGTTFWKEFAWNGRRVETRMIRLGEDGAWTFAAYAWNEAGTEAYLAPETGIPAVYEVAPGRRHTIPGTADCAACHASSPATVLGFAALQLSDDRDPLAPRAEPLRAGDVTLRSLIREGRLSPRRDDLAAHPPRIRERDPVARAAVGYLSANCGGCHNTRAPLARLGFSLLHDAAGAPGAPEPGRATTAGARSRFLLPGVAAESSYVVLPGAPERSTLLRRMQSRRPSTQMPPLGSVLADSAAVELVRRWIGAMPPHAARARARPRT